MDEGGEAFPADPGAAGAAGGGRGGRGGGRGGFGGGTAAQPADKSFTVIAAAANSSDVGQAGAARGGRGAGRGGRGGETSDSAMVDPMYAKTPVLARPPQGAITRPIDPARFDGRHFIDERTRSNDAG